MRTKRKQPLKIKAEILRCLFEHAEQEAPRECCGLLIGSAENRVVHEMRPSTNRWQQSPESRSTFLSSEARNRFMMAPQDVIFLARSLMTSRPVLGVYHSHIDLPAIFSAIDRKEALFGGQPLYPVSHLILEVRRGRAVAARLFEFQDGIGDFHCTALFGAVSPGPEQREEWPSSC